jgi:hypothetical protein
MSDGRWDTRRAAAGPDATGPLSRRKGSEKRFYIR